MLQLSVELELRRVRRDGVRPHLRVPRPGEWLRRGCSPQPFLVGLLVGCAPRRSALAVSLGDVFTCRDEVPVAVRPCLADVCERLPAAGPADTKPLIDSLETRSYRAARRGNRMGVIVPAGELERVAHHAARSRGRCRPRASPAAMRRRPRRRSRRASGDRSRVGGHAGRARHRIAGWSEPRGAGCESWQRSRRWSARDPGAHVDRRVGAVRLELGEFVRPLDSRGALLGCGDVCLCLLVPFDRPGGITGRVGKPHRGEAAAAASLSSLRFAADAYIAAAWTASASACALSAADRADRATLRRFEASSSRRRCCVAAAAASSRGLIACPTGSASRLCRNCDRGSRAAADSWGRWGRPGTRTRRRGGRARRPRSGLAPPLRARCRPFSPGWLRPRPA